MGNRVNINTIAIAVISILAMWMLLELQKKNKKIDELEKDIERRKDINSEVKKMLVKLLKEHAHEIGEEVASEISDILTLMNFKQESKATLTLAKIIENLLKKIYKGSDLIKEITKENNRKRPAYVDYLEAAKREKLISKEDFHLLSIVKIVRDKEAHELKVENNDHKMVSAFLCGVGVVLTLSRKIKELTKGQ